MEKGQYEEAAEPLLRMVASDANDPLGQCTLGAALLHTGHVDAARKTYSRDLNDDPDLGIAVYGIGIADLACRKYNEAFQSLRRSAEISPTGWTEGAITYTEALRSGFRSSNNPTASTDPLAVETTAFVKFRRGLLAQASVDLKALANEAPGFGAVESIGAVASFDESKPVTFARAGKLMAHLAKLDPEKLPHVTGTLLLKADASRVKKPAYVVFHIDGSPAAIVNREPYEFSWNTESVVNGIHTVRIVSYDGTGAPFAQREQRVLVTNNQPAQANRESSERRNSLSDRLRRLMTLKPSYWTAAYVSGRAALASGDRANAATFFERCVALDPERADARALLRTVYTASGVFSLIKDVPSEEKLVAMTFDDGPDEKITPSLLDILKAAGARATFFVVGSEAAKRPDIIRRMIQEGHEIGNHTYSHRNLELLPRDEVDREIMKTAVVLRAICGKRGDFLRPPGGHLGKYAKQALADYGMACVLWTFNCGTFEAASAIKYREQVIAAAKPGAVLLMHNGEEVTSAALPGIISSLKERGYKFVTLTELLRAAKKADGMGRTSAALNRNKTGTP